MEIDQEGNLWVAAVLGLYKVTLVEDTFRITHFIHDRGHTTSLSSPNVNSILIDAKDRIWVGTKFGLNILFPVEDKFTRFFKEDGLSDNDIKSVTEDENGNFWLATGNGLTLMSEENDQWSFEVFDESDGIISREFFSNAVWINTDGKIFLGGLNGFNHFYPNQVIQERNPPKLLFTDLKLFNRSVVPGPKTPLKLHVNHTDKITLNHRQSVFAIDHLAIHFTHADRNQFAYRLEGLESDWNYVGSSKQATYTNLDPGLYTFRVKSANHDGIWGRERQLFIEVLPPWWETFWFRFLAGFGVNSILLSFYIF